MKSLKGMGAELRCRWWAWRIARLNLKFNSVRARVGAASVNYYAACQELDLRYPRAERT